MNMMPIRSAIKLLLLLTTFTISGTAMAASFNCSGSLNPVEALICRNPGVSAMDDILSSEYRKTEQRIGRTNALTQSQRDWIRAIRDKCTDVPCLIRVYDDRITALQAMVTPPSVSKRPPAPPQESTIQMRILPPPPAPSATTDPPPSNTRVPDQSNPPSMAAEQAPLRPNQTAKVVSEPNKIRLESPRQSVRQEDNSPQRSGSSKSGMAFISTALFLAAQVLTPKRDRRYKTGYKNNRTVPKAVPWMYLAATLIFAAALFS